MLLHRDAVWDGSGRPAARADVLVQGNRIAEVWRDAAVQMHMLIQARAEAVDEGERSDTGIGGTTGAMVAQAALRLA